MIGVIMVAIQKASTGAAKGWMGYLPMVLPSVIILMVLPYLMEDRHSSNNSLRQFDVKTLMSVSKETNSDHNNLISKHSAVKLKEEKAADPKEIILATDSLKGGSYCPYQSMNDLTQDELHPAKGKRHMVTPPQGGSLYLVCCQTTKGTFNALVHEKWAPIGAMQFLQMVKSGYFSSTVPLMRCIKRFICQFGLNGSHMLNKKWRQGIPDDPNWLPEGPSHRKNEDGVSRFANGYLAYAGGGKNSRGNQFIVSLKDVETLAGGSPWEVPWGELVGNHSFVTFSKVYTGYGEKGPPQGKLSNQGVTDELKKEFPLLDYVTDCRVVDERIEES
jgi:cyclophilin family peptidyl-prolyl cis-trans isomerase